MILLYKTKYEEFDRLNIQVCTTLFLQFLLFLLTFHSRHRQRPDWLDLVANAANSSQGKHGEGFCEKKNQHILSSDLVNTLIEAG